MGIKVAVLTDHATHSKSNSVYRIVKAFAQHPEIEKVDVITRSDKRNTLFFQGISHANILAHTATEKFDFPADHFFEDNVFQTNILEYDFILLRLPRPIAAGFFEYIASIFPENRIVNKPSGIIKTGSKRFLLNLQEYTAPIKICDSIDKIESFKKEFPIVLKPFEEYGGKGIVRISGDEVWTGNIGKISFDEFAKIYVENPIEYLGMKYLKNVSEGDKRIVVANGKVLATSLRLPGEGMWLCNIAQGGKSIDAKPDARELEIIKYVNPILKKEGIFLYGLDTLVDDDGQRVISEINTLSVGGITPAEENSGLPITKIFVEEFINYVG